MSGEIKTIFFGKECRNCDGLDVHCVQVGILTLGVPAERGQTVVYIDEQPALRTVERIDECPAITGKNTKKRVVATLRKTARKAADRVAIDQIGNY